MASVSCPAPPARRRSGLLLALGVWVTGGALACGPSAADAGASLAQLRQAISGGQLERGYSGALALITVTRERVELCTATLLAPNLVATARHCVAPTPGDSVRCEQESATFDEPYDTDSLWVNHERALRDELVSYGLLPATGGGDELLPVAGVFVPEQQRVCGNDLALLLLSEPLDASDAQPIAPRLDQPVKPGETYTAVGFGSTPDPDQQGSRRSRAGLEVSCTPEDCADSTGMESTEFRGGDGVCSGDSGGPAIDAQGRVIGIASRSVGCTGSVYSALSSWRELVREVAELAVREGDYPEPEWLVPAPPEPAEPQPVEEESSPEDEPSTTGGDPAGSPSEGGAASNAPLSSPVASSPVASSPVASSPVTSGPLSSAPASGGAGGCSLPLRSSASSWPALSLLLGLALARRSRASRPRPAEQRR